MSIKCSANEFNNSGAVIIVGQRTEKGASVESKWSGVLQNLLVPLALIQRCPWFN